MNETQMRFIKANEAVYIRKEDIIKYLLEIAGSEDTDTRNRLEAAASNVEKVGKMKL